MTKRQKVRFDMFIRVVQFLQDNVNDFKTGIVAAQLLVLIAVVERLQILLGDQAAGFGDARFEFNDKDTARETLRQLMLHIAETSHSMVYAFPSIDLKFRMPRNQTDVEMLGTARAFLSAAQPYETAFVDDYLMDANFLTELETAIAAFEASMSATGTATDSHVEATADTGAEIRKGMIAVRTMNGAVTNKYRSDVGKLAAWLSASHVEKVPVLNPRSPQGKSSEEK